MSDGHAPSTTAAIQRPDDVADLSGRGARRIVPFSCSISIPRPINGARARSRRRTGTSGRSATTRCRAARPTYQRSSWSMRAPTPPATCCRTCSTIRIGPWSTARPASPESARNRSRPRRRRPSRNARPALCWFQPSVLNPLSPPDFEWGFPGSGGPDWYGEICVPIGPAFTGQLWVEQQTTTTGGGSGSGSGGGGGGKKPPPKCPPGTVWDP